MALWFISLSANSFHQVAASNFTPPVSVNGMRALSAAETHEPERFRSTRSGIDMESSMQGRSCFIAAPTVRIQAIGMFFLAIHQNLDALVWWFPWYLVF